MRSFWKTTEERTRPRWIWKIKVGQCNTNSAPSHLEQVDHSLCSPPGFKDLMNEVFSFIGKEPFCQPLTRCPDSSRDTRLTLNPNCSWLLHAAEDHQHRPGHQALHVCQLLQRPAADHLAAQVSPHPPVWAFARECQIWLGRLAGRNSAIAFSDRIKSGVVGEQIFLQITEPTEKDMGEYAIEFYDGKGGVRRTVELTGQGEDVWIQRFHWPTKF